MVDGGCKNSAKHKYENVINQIVVDRLDSKLYQLFQTLYILLKYDENISFFCVRRRLCIQSDPILAQVHLSLSRNEKLLVEISQNRLMQVTK